MARLSAFSVRIDASQVERLAAQMGELDGERLGERIVSAINDVAGSAYELSRRTILADINLTDAYLQRRMSVKLATKARPTAEIIASGARADITGLGHYGALQLSKSARWSEADGLARGIPIGPWPNWEPRVGDAARGLAPGEKQAGVRVEVRRGNQKGLRSAFSIPGIKHKDGSPVLFFGTGAPGKGTRDRNRKQPRQGVQALYGPSVYQLFRVAVERIEDRVGDDLRDAVVGAAERAFEEAIR